MMSKYRQYHIPFVFDKKTKHLSVPISMEVSGAMVFLCVLIVAVLFFVFTDRCHKRDGYRPNPQDSMYKRRNRTISHPRLLDDGHERVTLRWNGNPQMLYSFLIGHRHAPIASGHNITADDKAGNFKVHLKHINLESVSWDDKVQVEIWSDAHDDFHSLLPVECTHPHSQPPPHPHP